MAHPRNPGFLTAPSYQTTLLPLCLTRPGSTRREASVCSVPGANALSFLPDRSRRRLKSEPGPGAPRAKTTRIPAELLPGYVQDEVVIRPTVVRLGDFGCGST